MKVVLDLLQNYQHNVFDEQNAHKIIGGEWMPKLYIILKERGLELITGYDYIQQGKYSHKDLLLSEGLTPLTNKLISKGIKPWIVFSGESPNVDWRFYLFLKKNTLKYEYAMVFPGFREKIHSSTKFIPLYWPVERRNIHSLPIQKKCILKSIVMIASNKKQVSIVRKSNLKAKIKKQWISIITTKKFLLPLKDLYAFRMQGIIFFSQNNNFKLFGKGWNIQNNLSLEEKSAISILNPIEVDNKFIILSEHTFCICFENCSYPGYITEKIFDCFISSNIPIYYGAPDISVYIPEGTFIDMRKFNNFNDLNEFINGLSFNEIMTYFDNISNFLNSESFKKFDVKQFSTRIINSLVIA